MSLKRPVGIVLGLGIGFLVLKGLMNPHQPDWASSTSTSTTSSRARAVTAPVEPQYPTSTASYAQVDSEVGCKSKYSDEKKEDVFNAKYRDHWMTWRGEAVIVESDKVALNVDGVGIQDVTIDFKQQGAGYDLTKGSMVKVRFLMKSAGGCFLSFDGDDGELVN